jgi:uncharacterized protein YuzE
MNGKLTFSYDREADILYIDSCKPYPEQESEEIPDDVVVRTNPASGDVENLEVLFFSTRLLRKDLFELPVQGSLRLVG